MTQETRHAILQVSEVLVVATTAGAVIGGKIGGSTGAQVGAATGLVLAGAYLNAKRNEEPEPQDAYLRGLWEPCE